MLTTYTPMLAPTAPRVEPIIADSPTEIARNARAQAIQEQLAAASGATGASE